MNRRYLTLLILLNTLISLVIALAVVWVYEIRRPEAEELALLYSARPEAVLAATPMPSVPVPVAATQAQALGEDAITEPTATIPSDPEQEVYVVRGGDSLVAIALRYNVAVDDIVRVNGLANPDYVFSGQRLIIPSDSTLGAEPIATPVNVVGVEIAAIDGAGDLATESLQVVNDSDQAYTLDGWQVAQEDGPTYTFGDVPLFPGGSIRLNSRAGLDTSIDLYWAQSQAVWTSGTVAQLLNERGIVIHSYVVP